MTLYDLAEGIRKCTACPLHKSRMLAVPGEGSKNAKIMFVGDAPNGEEDRQGLPLVGKHEPMLTQLLKVLKLKREEVFVTNVVKCHSSENRTPLDKEIKTCNDLWLKKQMELIKPKLVVLLGRVAVKSLLGKVSELHEKIVEKNGIKYLVIYDFAKDSSKIKKLME
jgi:uracil-DNA glycosylase